MSLSADSPQLEKSHQSEFSQCRPSGLLHRSFALVRQFLSRVALRVLAIMLRFLLIFLQFPHEFVCVAHGCILLSILLAVRISIRTPFEQTDARTPFAFWN